MPSASGRPRLRFSLLTLVLGVLLVGACFGLWWRWAPWVCHTTGDMGSSVEYLIFSPDERFLLASQTDTNSIYRLVPSGVQLMAAIKKDFSSEWSCAKFSNDGALLALSKTGDDSLSIWSTTTASVVGESTDGVILAEFGNWAPDNRHLVVNYCSEMSVWDAQTGHCVARMNGHTDRILSVRFSPDGRRVTSASADGTVRVWDAVTGKEQLRLEGHGWACEAAFSPEGKQVATANLDGTVRIWNAETGALDKEIGHLLSNNRKRRFTTVDFLADGRHVSSSGSDGRVRTWDIVTGQLTSERNGGFSPDGRRTAREINSRAYVLDTSEAQEYSIPRSALAELGEPTPKTRCVEFSPTGQYIATGHEDGSIRLWVRRRPEWWWGIAWLPEFWVALLAGGGLLVIAIQNLRRRRLE